MTDIDNQSHPQDVASKRSKRSLAEVITALRRPKVAVMLGLGFGSGLPFLLIGNTLSYWLGDAHVNLALIGFLSWVGMAYSLKFIWARWWTTCPLPCSAVWAVAEAGCSGCRRGLRWACAAWRHPIRR